MSRGVFTELTPAQEAEFYRAASGIEKDGHFTGSQIRSRREALILNKRHSAT